MSKVIAYLALNGDDATAVLNDRTKPYKTHKAALDALKPHSDKREPTGIIDIGHLPKPKTAA